MRVYGCFADTGKVEHALPLLHGAYQFFVKLISIESMLYIFSVGISFGKITSFINQQATVSEFLTLRLPVR